MQLPEHHDEAQQVAEVAGDAEEVEKGPHEHRRVVLHWPLSYYKTSPLLQPSENSFETVRGLRVPARHCAGVGLLATS